MRKKNLAVNPLAAVDAIVTQIISMPELLFRFTGYSNNFGFVVRSFNSHL